MDFIFDVDLFMSMSIHYVILILVFLIILRGHSYGLHKKICFYKRLIIMMIIIILITTTITIIIIIIIIIYSNNNNKQKIGNIKFDFIYYEAR